MNVKKLLIIIGMLALVVVGGYFAFQKIMVSPAAPGGPAASSTNFLPTTDGTEPSSASQLTAVTDSSVADFWIDQGDKTLYVVGTDSAIYAIPAGQTASPEKMYTLSGDPLYLSPSPDGSMALVQTKGVTGDLFSVINPGMGSQAFLPLGTTAANWGLSNKEVIYLRGESFDTRNPAGLYRFTLATKHSTFIGPLDMVDVTVHLVSADQLVIEQKATAGVISGMFLYNLKTHTLAPYGTSGAGLTARWSPSGPKAITSTFAPDAHLSYMNQGTVTELAQETLPEKCAFSGTALLCGVPTDPFNTQSWSLPDDYRLGKFHTSDVLEKITPETGASTIVYTPTAAIDIYKPLYDGTTLYFINRYDNKLYALQLQ